MDLGVFSCCSLSVYFSLIIIIPTMMSSRRYQDNSVPGHLGPERMRHFGTLYWTFRYSVLDISILNERQIGTSKEILIWLNLKTYFVFFFTFTLDVVYANFYVFLFNRIFGAEVIGTSATKSSFLLFIAFENFMLLTQKPLLNTLFKFGKQLSSFYARKLYECVLKHKHKQK